jgi:hypothetical protein
MYQPLFQNCFYHFTLHRQRRELITEIPKHDDTEHTPRKRWRCGNACAARIDISLVSLPF